MGAIAQVMDEAWPQKMAILRRSPKRPEMALYLDTDTYLRCLADEEAFRFLGPVPARDGTTSMAGMRVYQVIARDRHVRVAEVVGG